MSALSLTRFEIGLGHLADLLVEGHRLEPRVGLRRRGRVVVLRRPGPPAADRRQNGRR